MSETTTRLERTSLVVPGERSELRLEDARISIDKDLGAQHAPTSVAFPVAEVRGTTLQRPSRGEPGWLHVAVVGGSPAPATPLGATLDPYTLPITSRNVAAARRLGRLVTQHVQQRGLPPERTAGTGRISSSVTVSAPPSPVPSEDEAASDGTLIGALRELAELHAAGALSDDEFQRAKAKVLAEG